MAKTMASDLLQPCLITGTRLPKEAFKYLRNYLAGQFVGATRDDVLMDEVLKCLFCKLYIEASNDAKELLSPDQGKASEYAETIHAIFAKVRRDYPDIYEPNTQILLDAESIRVVMQECAFALLDAETDLCCSYKNMEFI